MLGALLWMISLTVWCQIHQAASPSPVKKTAGSCTTLELVAALISPPDYCCWLVDHLQTDSFTKKLVVVTNQACQEEFLFVS